MKLSRTMTLAATTAAAVTMTVFTPHAVSSAATKSASGDLVFEQVHGAASTVKYIKNKKSGKCLTVYRASKANNATVNQYRCVGAANQRWNMEWTGGVSYALRNVNSNKCLTVHGASKSNGAAIDQYTCLGEANQAFYINISKPHKTEMRPSHSRKCLDVQGGSTADNGRVIQWSCNGGKNQAWSS